MEFVVPKEFGNESVTVTFHQPNRYAVSGQKYFLILKDRKEVVPACFAGQIFSCPKIGFQVSRTTTKRKGHAIKTITITTIRDLRFRYPREAGDAWVNRLSVCQLWHHQAEEASKQLAPQDIERIIRDPMITASETFSELKRQRLSTGIDWLIGAIDYRMPSPGHQRTYDALEHLDQLYDWRTKTGHTLLPASLIKPEYRPALEKGHHLTSVTDEYIVLTKDRAICRAITNLLNDIKVRGSGEPLQPITMLAVEDDEPLELDELQQQAIDHVASPDGWLTVINGGPGTGKTEIARQLFQRYRHLGMGFLIFMGTMAQEIRKRLGITKNGEEVSTIHHAWHAKPEEITGARIIIIDEFSNVNSSLFLMALQAAPAATRLVILQDLNQIPPIKPGSPALALMQVYAKQGHCFTLRKNFRVDQGAMMIAEINYCVLHHQPQIAFQALKVVDAARHIAWPAFRKRKEKEKEDCNENVTGKFILDSFSPRLVNLRQLESWQVMTFTNKNVDAYNAVMEQYLISQRYLPFASTEEQLKDQFHVREVKLERGRGPAVPPLYLCLGAKLTATKTCRWQGDKSDNHGYDEIRNGSIFSVSNITDTPDGYAVDTTCGLKFLLNAALHVSVSDLRPAYCVTVCRALGSEWDHAMVLVPPKTNPQFWTCEYLYVACSRAKRSLRIIGWKFDIQQMILTPGKPRRTYLSEILE